MLKRLMKRLQKSPARPRGPRRRYRVRLYGGPAGGRDFIVGELVEEIQVPLPQPLQVRELLADDGQVLDYSERMQIRRAVYRLQGQVRAIEHELAQHPELQSQPVPYTFHREES